ncbi:MAG: CoA pyrophosphatase [Deltaproteobacteria bacterium]|nr:CoA pyrophosphatase [Deltaproteobacteria bacterium]
MLVPLVWTPEPVALLTLRPLHLSRHGGEVCFPGGRPEAGDEDLWATAVREAHEELGLVVAERLGELSAMPLYTSEFRLVPFVAAVADTPLRPDPSEVAAVLRLSIREVLEQPEIEGISFAVGDVSGIAPLFRTDGHVVYGATAYTFLELLEVLAPLYERTLPPVRPGAVVWQDLLRAPAE